MFTTLNEMAEYYNGLAEIDKKFGFYNTDKTYSIEERGDYTFALVKVPGFSKNDLEVSESDDFLNVSGETLVKIDDQDVYARSIDFDIPLNSKEIKSAELKNGLLVITLKDKEKDKKLIAIH